MSRHRVLPRNKLHLQLLIITVLLSPLSAMADLGDFLEDGLKKIENVFIQGQKTVKTVTGKDEQPAEKTKRDPLGQNQNKPINNTPVEPAQRVQYTDSLSKSGRSNIQAALNTMGYSVGIADGVFGSNTVQGIRQYQADISANPTGALTQHQHQRLLNSSNRLTNRGGNSQRSTTVNTNSSVEVGNGSNSNSRQNVTRGEIENQSDVRHSQTAENLKNKDQMSAEECRRKYNNSGSPLGSYSKCLRGVLKRENEGVQLSGPYCAKKYSNVNYKLYEVCIRTYTRQERRERRERRE